MAAIPYVLAAEPYYKAFHENLLAWGKEHPPVLTDHFVCLKADYHSWHAGLLRPDDQGESENLAFALPLVLPRQSEPFKRAIIILHGLNESEYRKFFPWACTLASAGFPVVLFPMTFLVNRRPRRWMNNAETQRCLRERQAMPGNTVATRYNTILSARLDRHPERLFLGGRQSYGDLLDLVASLRHGTFSLGQVHADTLVSQRPFAEGTRVDFLGYSIGGYLTMVLLLEEGDRPELAESRAVIFAAAAPFAHANPALNANTLSPFILDGLATARVRQFYGSEAAELLLDSPQGRWCRAMFRAEHNVLDPPLQRLRNRLLTIGNTADTVVPPDGMAETFGTLDCRLALGAHEYPFSLTDVWEVGVTRSMVRSYNVHPNYEAGFRRFIEAISDFLA
jgi:pimeloyl-ACP methyl ester carboxylesterase